MTTCPACAGVGYHRAGCAAADPDLGGSADLADPTSSDRRVPILVTIVRPRLASRVLHSDMERDTALDFEVTIDVDGKAYP